MTSHSRQHAVRVYPGEDPGYLPHLHIQKLDKTMDNVEMALRDKLNEFDSVLVQGLSGIVPASIFCYRYGKNLVVLRKSHEVSHGSWLEGTLTDRYVILDDFMACGKTVRRLLEAATTAGKPLPKWLILYAVQDSRLGYNKFPEYEIDRTKEEAKAGLCRFTVRPFTKAPSKRNPEFLYEETIPF